MKPKLVIRDGNAFFILGAAQKVARDNNMKNWEEIRTKAMSGDYSNLLNTLGEHFELITEEEIEDYGSDCDDDCICDDCGYDNDECQCVNENEITRMEEEAAGVPDETNN